MTSNKMKYVSTRGGSDRFSFEEAVMTGLAPNGGLLVPMNMPELPDRWREDWSNKSFKELALEIFSLFIGEDEIPRGDLSKLIDASYSTFKIPEVAPLYKLEDRLHVLELFHGPTLAFKDVALQFLGNLFEYFLQRRNKGKAREDPSREDPSRECLTVVGATSGDTGSAAIYGLRGKKDISVFILHPKGRVTPIQEAQMTTVTDANVFNLSVRGTFDDCQDIVKSLFSDQPFNSAYHLGAVNSINWARILAQISYYFSSYFSLLRSLSLSPAQATERGLTIRYAVPTGNFGDVLAGWYARRLGLPMGKLAVATNENDILQRFWTSGRYEKVDSSPGGPPQTASVQGSSDGSQAGVCITHSPAMDIVVSSNFERLLYHLTFEVSTQDAIGDEAKMAKAGEIISNWMKDLKSTNKVDIDPKVVEAARTEFDAERVSNAETIEQIRKTYELQPDRPYVVDPHTAVGLAAASRLKCSPSTYQICLATAHPAKFASAVVEALKDRSDFDFDRDVTPEELRGLTDLPRRVIDVEGVDPELTKKVIIAEAERLYGSEPRAVAGEATASV